jgi:hypothetical protein
MLRINLNNHSQVHIPPESPFIIHLFDKYYNKKNINIERFLTDLKQEPFLLVWNIDYKKLRSDLQKIVVPTFQKFCLEILKQQQKPNLFIGDKTPTNSLFGKQLNILFPNSKFIWIIRDYRAQVNSMLKVNFEKKIISSLAIRWVNYNKKIENLKNRFPEQVFLLKYEDLVTSPEKKYKEICMFLGIDFELSILSTSKINKEFQPKHHKSLEDGINTKHIDEWENELTKKQLKICEAVAGKYGEKFGYKKTTKTSLPINPIIYLGIIYGELYLLFIKTMYALPLSLRVFINRKIIYKNATFWKEAKAYYMD